MSIKAKIQRITGLSVRRIERMKKGTYAYFHSDISAYKAFHKLLVAGVGASIDPANERKVYIRGAIKENQVKAHAHR